MHIPSTQSRILPLPCEVTFSGRVQDGEGQQNYQRWLKLLMFPIADFFLFVIPTIHAREFSFLGTIISTAGCSSPCVVSLSLTFCCDSLIPMCECIQTHACSGRRNSTTYHLPSLAANASAPPPQTCAEAAMMIATRSQEPKQHGKAQLLLSQAVALIDTHVACILATSAAQAPKTCIR